MHDYDEIRDELPLFQHIDMHDYDKIRNELDLEMMKMMIKMMIKMMMWIWHGCKEDNMDILNIFL